MKKKFKKTLMLIPALLTSLTLMAQEASVKSLKTSELNALLKTKTWTISDIARFIPYDISMVDASFNSWLKSKDIVFYKEVNGQKKAILPEDIDNSVKAGYNDKLGLEIPNNYFTTWKDFFAKRCYAHGTAEYVMAKYQNREISLKECIEKMKNSDAPKSYIAYMKSFVFYALQQEPTAWEDLSAILKDIIAKDKKTGTCLAFILCRTNNAPQQWIRIIKQVPKTNKFFYGCADDSFRKDNDIMSTALKTIEPEKEEKEYGGCLAGVNLYPDGRVIMRRTNANLPTSTLRSIKEQSECLSKYDEQEYSFLYNPNGENLYGYLQEKGALYYKLQPNRPTIWGASIKHTAGEQYELSAGYKLDSNGNVIGESYINMSLKDLTEQLKQPIKGIEEWSAMGAELGEYQAREAQEKADDEFMYKEVTRLRKKYGNKPVDAMIKMAPYEGMPEGILKEYIATIKGAKVKLWEEMPDPIWKKYHLCGLLSSLGSDIIIWCLNGVVTHVYHDGAL